MSIRSISEVRKAVASSHRWMRKHASKNGSGGVVPEVPAGTVYFILLYFLREDSRRCSPQDLSDHVMEDIYSLSIGEVDVIIDMLYESLDDSAGSITDDDLYDIICAIDI